MRRPAICDHPEVGPKMEGVWNAFLLELPGLKKIASRKHAGLLMEGGGICVYQKRFGQKYAYPSGVGYDVTPLEEAVWNVKMWAAALSKDITVTFPKEPPHGMSDKVIYSSNLDQFTKR